nr:hypothetical protein [uncultured bacterium]
MSNCNAPNVLLKTILVNGFIALGADYQIWG